MFVPLVHAPGHAQADFGEAIGIIGGVECKVHFFAFYLPHSDACFVAAYPAETKEAFCDGHVKAFGFFGGVPKAGKREYVQVLRRIKAAKFPTVRSLDSFDFAALPSLNKALVMELARCEYIERHENVIALGNSGMGKSHIALGLGLAACQKGLSVGWRRATRSGSCACSASSPPTSC
jgi:DNA replication protein DnaC